MPCRARELARDTRCTPPGTGPGRELPEILLPAPQPRPRTLRPRLTESKFSSALRPEFRDQVAAGPRGPLRTAVPHIRGSQMVEPQQVQDRRVDIEDVMRFFHCPQADFVGRADHLPA